MSDDPTMTVGPMPVPMTFNIDVVPIDPASGLGVAAMIRVAINHPMGITLLFLAPDDAKRIASMLANEAVKAKAGVGGLVIPGVHVVPDVGNGHRG